MHPMQYARGADDVGRVAARGETRANEERVHRETRYDDISQSPFVTVIPAIVAADARISHPYDPLPRSPFTR